MVISEETWRLIRGEENIAVEWKETYTTDLCESAIAFANAEGGVILIGVKDRKDENGKQYGELVGGRGICTDAKSELAIKNKLTGIQPVLRNKITTEEHEPGYGVFMISIPEGDNKPYCTSGGTYKIRRQGHIAPIFPPEMSGLILGKHKPRMAVLLDTPGGRVSVFDYLALIKVTDEKTQEEVKQGFPGKWEIKTITRPNSPRIILNPFGGVKDDSYTISPPIRWVVVNDGPATADDIYIYLNFPENVEIKRYREILIGSPAGVSISGKQISYFIKNLHQDQHVRIPDFFIEFPRDDSSYIIEYKIIARDFKTAGRLTVAINNYFYLIVEV
jgi:hypothetical protein